MALSKVGAEAGMCFKRLGSITGGASGTLRSSFGHFHLDSIESGFLPKKLPKNDVRDPKKRFWVAEDRFSAPKSGNGIKDLLLRKSDHRPLRHTLGDAEKPRYFPPSSLLCAKFGHLDAVDRGSRPA